MTKKNYVIDTSVYLTDSESIKNFGNNDIIIPLKVLEEIDCHKKRQDSVGANARRVIRFLDTLCQKGDLSKGVRIDKGKGILSVKSLQDINLEHLKPNLSPDVADHIIVATALTVKNDQPNRKAIMVTNDINMRVICNSLGLECEEYNPAQVVESIESLYTGFSSLLVDEQIIDQLYSGEELILERPHKSLCANEFVMLISNANEKKTALARYLGKDLPLKRISKFKKGIWGVNSRNKEQLFALELLMDPAIPVVTLVGKAGSGKTLCAIAPGLEQVMSSTDSKKEYKRLIVSRPVQPLGKDIGFLPGTLEEKMTPWLTPIQDNLKFLMGDDRATLEMYMEKGMIEIEALTYIRGRSISNAFIIIDEAQNLSSHELKTIITRVGEGTKIVLTGDIEQIDSPFVDETTNGLTYAIEKFKNHQLAGHVTLHKGERSKVASLAARIL